MDLPKNHAASKSLVVVLDETSSDGGGAPTKESKCDDIVGTEALDSRDPEDLEDDVGHKEQCDQVTKLIALQVDVLFEAENSCIA